MRRAGQTGWLVLGVALLLVAVTGRVDAGRLRGGTSSGGEVEMRDARQRGIDELQPADMSEIERVVGEPLTFVLVELDNTKGKADSGFVPWMDKALGVDGRKDQYGHIDVGTKLLFANLRDVTKQLFDTAKVGVGAKGKFVLVFPEKFRMSGAREIRGSRYDRPIFWAE